jgi:carbon monoxide dehydrogenase subunit G
MIIFAARLNDCKIILKHIPAMSTIKLRNSRTLQVTRAEIWPLIFDPECLIKLIPGCEELKRVNENEYKGVVRVGIAGVSGKYNAIVRLIELDPPNFCRFEGEIIGNTGIVQGEASFQLKDKDQCSVVTYRASGTITGALSKISPRFIEGVLNSLIKLGLNTCEKNILEVRVSPT